MILVNNKIPKIVKVSFKYIFPFRLNKKTRPSPALIDNPAIVAPRPIVFARYASVIRTLDAQFGIMPTRLEITGEK